MFFLLYSRINRDVLRLLWKSELYSSLWPSCDELRGGMDASQYKLNTEPAKKPSECLEYIVVHELAHLIEPTHNNRFLALMDRLMPKWSFYRGSLNEAPLAYEEWNY